MSTLDDYIKNMTPGQLAAFNHLHGIIKQLAPDAGQKLSYGIPTFTYKGKYLIYFGAYKTHMSLYPATDEMVKAIGPELEKLRVSKGTIHFTEEKPVPDAMIKQIIKFRIQSIEADIA